MGKGVPAKHWEATAEKGFQLVYGAMANLFVDRHGEYIGYGPEAMELVGHPGARHLHAAAVGQPRVARVWCICFRNREEREDPGAFLTADCRGNLQRIARRVRGPHRPAPARRHRARDDVAEDERRRHAGRRGRLEALLLPHRPVLRVPADHPQGDGVRRRSRPRHDPGRPRGRPGPDRAELPVRPRRDDGRQPVDVPPGLPAGRPRVQRLPVLHAEAVHGRVGQRLPPQHLALAAATRTRSCPRATTSRSRRRSASTRSAGSSSTSAR